MAVYTNLAIDCGDDDSAAADWVRLYEKLRLTTDAFGETGCDVEHIRPHRSWGQPDNHSASGATWHTVCVCPSGIGNGLPLDETLIDEIRPQLYEPLRRGIRFRTAWLGWEAQDTLGEQDWLDDLAEIRDRGRLPEMPGLVLSDELIPRPGGPPQLKPFCTGYHWIVTPDAS